jgi:sulfane dehydrogenase subunit SoxC
MHNPALRIERHRYNISTVFNAMGGIVAIRITRRDFLTSTAATVGAATLHPEKVAEVRAQPPRSLLGAPRREYGDRSPYEKSARYFKASSTPGTGASRTPIQDLHGIITPSSLHFERHHAGVPQIDPAHHELMIHGLVRRPLIFTMKDLLRLPSVSRVHFLECAGNTASDQLGQPGADPQRSHGLLSCTEWTGVLLTTLLAEAGVKSKASWLVAEGSDASRLARSIPLKKALDDVIVAYGQNGEALRPEQGYPVRLVVPGWEGNVNIKWLGRIDLVDQPYMTRDEAAFYTDLMPNGKARMFTFVMEAKSVITRPAGGQHLDGRGFYEIEGMAWSGRGRITRVEVSTDDGRSWRDAELNSLVLPRAVTRFRCPWQWDGAETALQSRCTDESGYRQPTRAELVSIRGLNATDHYNGIKTWYVHRDGSVSHV